MYAQDKTLTCADCGQEFTFTSSEQQFYADRQFTEPRRCPSCRAARKASRGDSGGGGGYSSGGYGGRWRLRSGPARDVLRDVLELRQRGAGAVPPDQRQAGLLQRLLQVAAVEQLLGH